MRPALGWLAVVLIVLPACDRSAPPGEPQRSRLFVQLSDDAASGVLQNRLKAKFPALEFKVMRLGPSTKTEIEGNRRWAFFEVRVDVTGPGFDRLALLAELEAYLTSVVVDTGAEFDGKVQDRTADGKKAGFWFAYKTRDASGKVGVTPEAGIAGGHTIVVEELE
jgi:hypothetical protein